jgi:hypothetical protein
VKAVKIRALAILAAISLAGPVAEAVLTGRVEEFGTYALVETLLSFVPIFWWYHLDKADQGYRAGPLMNAGVVAAVVVALPIYFVRTRGWKRGAISTAKGIAVVAGMWLLDMLGEAIGKALTG